MSRLFHQELLDCRDCPLHQSLPGGRFCCHPARHGWIIGSEEIPHFPPNCPLPPVPPAPMRLSRPPERLAIRESLEVGP